MADSLRRKIRVGVEDLKDIRDQGKLAISDPSKISMFKGMQTNISDIFKSLDDNYNTLCDLVDDDGQQVATAADHAYRAQAKRYLHESYGYMVTINDDTARQSLPGTSSMLNNTNMSGCRGKTKLPTLELPKFRGDDRTKWPHFKDTFVSLVMEDPDLRDIDRFHYLLRSLEGSAAAVIAQLSVTEQNFSVAWETLEEAFDNKRLLASAYLDQLMELKPLPFKPNAPALGRTIAKLSETVAAFKLLQIPDREEFLYFYLACRTLDHHTREAFELQNTSSFPSFNDLIKYLRSRCIASELCSNINSSNFRNSSSGRTSPGVSKPRNVALVTQPNPFPSNEPSTKNISSNCPICNGDHVVTNCLQFSTATVENRIKLLQAWRGCRNCLRPGHGTFQCPSKWRCRFCKKKHHSLLHLSTASPENSPVLATSPSTSSRAKSDNTPIIPNRGKPTSLNIVSHQHVEVMLGTVVCNINDKHGESASIRLAIDSGSHFSFITRSFAERLGLVVETHSTSIWGIGETPLSGFKGRALCSLTPTHSAFPKLVTYAIVIDTITSALPGFETEEDMWHPFQKYPLADPQFWVTRPIDFLLGGDLFSDILTGEMITISSYLPKLLGTVFGFTVLGRVKDLSEASSLCALHSGGNLPLDSLSKELHRFWELEEPPQAKVVIPEDEACESLYRNTHFRLPDGRYVVRLPFKIPEPQISGTYGMSLRRLEHLERRLERSSDVREKYHAFMHEYLSLGHMELSKSRGKVIIPHHCILKDTGTEKKLRVVFDAAARTSSGSLNDMLQVGPKMQASLVNILINFRRHKFVFTTDLVKMYRQILIHPEDRKFQHILWRFKPSDAVQEYELKTLSYGLTSAPYLAIRTVKQLTEDEGQQFPLAVQAVLEDMYVDDLVTGSSTLQGAIKLRKEVIALFSKGCFELSKWASNDPRILAGDIAANQQTTSVPVSFEPKDDSSPLKILGLQWDSASDTLSYKVSPPPSICSKRAVLSAVAKIFDPLGYLGPVVVLAKELIQEAWKRDLSWDATFPIDLQDTWNKLVAQLPMLSQISIPRWVASTSSRYNLLVFADASERAYCATAYLRSTTRNGSSKTLLVLAKTKLAPVKTMTIPRLELCAALLAARVWESLRPFCEKLIPHPTFHFFSDSNVVLSWLQTPSYKLKTFVANRVVKILELTSQNQWRHVASTDNPSDIGSRGLTPELLIGNSLWFHGPPWANREPSEWPCYNVEANRELPEMKTITSNAALVSSKERPFILDWISRFSRYDKLIRSLAYGLRFIDHAKKRYHPSCALTLSEIRRATRCAVKIVQRYAFFNGRTPSQLTTLPEKLICLQPFLDEAGILSVGGRLKHANLSSNTRHPALLPADSHFTQLLIRHYHAALLHSGPTLLLANIRRHYWVVSGRNAVRKITRQCVRCRKLCGPPINPPMGDLPSYRFKESRAFLHVGIDFAGPFLVKQSALRKSSASKAYLCLFVCLSTKALHLELVSSLSTSAFRATLDRFIGRRGLPERLFSDNGTNFVGASNELQELYKWLRRQNTEEELKLYAIQHEIEWTFQPPFAPHFGGIWEAGVKSVKRLLRSVYGENSMSFEELSTLLIRVEATLNSRPLCPLSNEPDDLDYLTPGHFLIGAPLLSIPEKSLTGIPENRLSRWQLVSQKSQHFWNRWRHEYLSTLQQRSKWIKPSRNLRIDDYVLLKEENAPRMRWPAGRILQVHPGADGVVRVVTIRTLNSILKRPANKVILLVPNTDDNLTPSEQTQ